MWLGLLVVFAVLLAVIGGVVVGGIFALILVPIAAIILIFGVVMSMWGRATSGQPAPEDERSRSGSGSDPPIYPHGAHQNASAGPATPGDLVDARQKSQ
jgi:hypothetical protein